MADKQHFGVYVNIHPKSTYLKQNPEIDSVWTSSKEACERADKILTARSFTEVSISELLPITINSDKE